MILATASGAFGHVPTYSGACTAGCCTPPHHHDTSQVFYLRGSGGLELHMDQIGMQKVALDGVGAEAASAELPSEAASGGSQTGNVWEVTDGHDHIDVSAVFRDEPDRSTYALYVGCGGCMEDDPILAPRFAVDYGPAVVEPFTQSAYHSFVDNKQHGNYEFPLSNLSTCDSEHFTVRLVQFPNASGDIVWAPVVGRGEMFTPRELIEFPLFVLSNHGYAWNELEVTWWVVVGATVMLWIVMEGRNKFYVRQVRTAQYVTVQRDGQSCYERQCIQCTSYDWRALLYSVAVYSFAAAAVEELIHLFFALSRGATLEGSIVETTNSDQFWVLLSTVLAFTVLWRTAKKTMTRCGPLIYWFVFVAAVAPVAILLPLAFVAIGVGQGLPLCVTFLIRNAMHLYTPLCFDPKDSSVWLKLRTAWWFRWHPGFAVLEVASGISFFFLLGAGFYAGPACLILAGLWRFGEFNNSIAVHRGTTARVPLHSPTLLLTFHQIKSTAVTV